MAREIHWSAVFVLLGVCAGCADVSVMPVNSADNKISDVCLKLNPKVTIPDFVYILEEGFARHGIRTKVYAELPSNCDYALTYYATVQKDDSAASLKNVHLGLYKGTQLVGYADRDSPPKGLLGSEGVELSLWDSTRSKIDPMLDELLEDFTPSASAQ